MIVLSHPTGNQNSRAVLRGLADAQLLHSFHTSIAVFPDSFWGKLGGQLGTTVRRRSYDDALKPQIETYPKYELAMRVAQQSKVVKQLWYKGESPSMYHACQHIDRRISHYLQREAGRSLKAVYAYEDMALRAFEQAKKMGKLCCYDLPIGYWRAYHDLLGSERQKQTDWAVTLGGFNSPPEKLAQKDKELALADHIFVASQFTKETLSYYPEPLKAAIHLIPYGFPEVATAERHYDFQYQKRPLRLLFIGGLSQRKGLSYLFEAVEQLGEAVELTIVGNKQAVDCPALDAALQRHTWIPSLPHAAILQLMRQQDVLLFPSLFEGFGLVITEAMSQGTPVIATERTAAPDLITHGEDGWIIPAASTPGIQQAIEQLLLTPQKVQQVGKAAKRKAQQRPWSVYQQQMADRLQAILNR
jgi:glycosyltransferase involved in cell wall biosynthesis